MSKRVVFTFDDKSLRSLEDVQSRAEFTTLGTAVLDSVQINDALQEEALEGYTEVVVRNPKTKMEKTIIIPSLKRVTKSTKKDD